MTEISLGFSPCPNDTFIFDALVNQKIDTENIRFKTIMADVEELNMKALSNELDVTKVSYRTYAEICNNYNLLDSGGALGHNCGPLLITKNNIPVSELISKTIAIPGKNTTANFLLSYYLPEFDNKKIYLFSDIEDAVFNEEVYAGVIIHENRFTYKQKGLKLVQDLGKYWESVTKFPIPLGGIAIKKHIDTNLQQTINKLIKQSIQYSFKNNKVISPFITQNATEMSETIMKQHIKLYVNDYSLSLGEKGKNAVNFMMKQLTDMEFKIVQ